jgi:probable phosphoglycerate mutase
MPLVALLRHGEEDAADWRKGVETRSARGLSHRGRAQAEAARDFLASLDATRVACSDVPRAIETAEIVAAGRPVDVLPGLCGLRLGEWEGTSPLDHPDFVRVLTDPTARPPGGESLADLEGRFRAALMQALPDTGDAIVVGHRLANAAFLAGVMGLPLADAGLIQQDPGGITILARVHNRLSLQMLNVRPLDPLRLTGVTSLV